MRSLLSAYGARIMSLYFYLAMGQGPKEEFWGITMESKLQIFTDLLLTIEVQYAGQGPGIRLYHDEGKLPSPALLRKYDLAGLGQARCLDGFPAERRSLSTMKCVPARITCFLSRIL